MSGKFSRSKTTKADQMVILNIFALISMILKQK